MYTSFALENFRNFPKLELTGLEKINIITGTNGSGKTAVLEAILLNASACNTAAISQINALRGELFSDISNDRPFRSIFNDFAGRKPATLSGKWKSAEGDTTPANRDLQIKPITAAWKIARFPDSEEKLAGLEMDFKGSGGRATAKIVWNEEASNPQQGQIAIQRGANNPPAQVTYRMVQEFPQSRVSLSSIFLTPASRDVLAFIYQLLVNATREKNISSIVDLIKIVDGRVTNLVPLSEGSSKNVYVDIGLERLMSVTMMGAGFANLLQIACGIVQTASPVIIIDEIEDGLHYTTFPKIALALIDFALQRNVQFFLSTHSGEFLEAFVDAARARQFADVCSFRLAEQNGIRIATRFDANDLDNAKKIELDVR